MSPITRGLRDRQWLVTGRTTVDTGTIAAAKRTPYAQERVPGSPAAEPGTPVLGRMAATSLAAGSVGAALALRPSIMPRTGLDRGLLVAGSLAAGAIAGTAFEGGSAALDSALPGSRDALQVALPVAGGVAGAILALHPPTSALAWKGASAAVLAGATAAASSLLDAAPALRGRDDAPGIDEQGLALVGAGAAAAGLALHHHVQVGRSMVAPEARSFVVTPFERTLAEPGRVTSVTGGPASAISREELGTIGRKFSEGAIPADTITALTGRAAKDPIRVYSPLRADASSERQVNAAMSELERLGAFERRHIVVAVPAGGLIEHSAVEAAEVMADGDIATVGLQFSRKPSILSTNKPPLGAELHGALLGRIRTRLEGIPEEARPRVTVYGESLGAAAATRMLLDDAPGRLAALGASHGLVVGAPSSAALVRARAAGTVIEHAEGAAFPPVRPGATPRLDVMNHENDAVTMLAPDVLWKRPDWLTGARPAGVPQSHTWLPVVTGVQTAIDLKNAIKIPGTGHDYDLDAPAALATALGRDSVDEALLARVRGYSVAARERRDGA